MSNPRIPYVTGSTIYALIWKYDKVKIRYPKDEVFETYGTNNRTVVDYAVPLVESADNFYIPPFVYYILTWPSGIRPGIYEIHIKLQAGAAPAINDYLIGSFEKKIPVQEESVEEVLELYNSAIGKLGGGYEELIISSLDDKDSKSLYWCNLYYPKARKQVLMSYDCIEATKYAILENKNEEIAKSDWEYSFNLPEDYLRILAQIYETDKDEKCEYALLNNYLLTNDLSDKDGKYPYIKYIYDLQDLTKFGVFTKIAVETSLASMIAVPLGRGWDVKEKLILEYLQLNIPDAKDNNQKQVYNEKAADWIIDSVR